MTKPVRPKAPIKAREPHTIIIARGEDIRHFQVRPWIAALCGSVLAAAAIGYLTATTYLVLRDDLIDATTSRQARLQQAYEDRISALRSQVDRITSRQMLDQQLMESKVGELLTRQKQLSQINERLDRARPEEAREDAQDTSSSPDLRAGLELDVAQKLAFAGAAVPEPAFPSWSRQRNEPSAAERSDRLFSELGQSLKSIETEQIDRINTLAADAYETADAIQGALRYAGVGVEGDDASGMGGPFVALDNPGAFDAKLAELDDALDLVDRMKTQARSLPIANPSPGYAISSNFGARTDPFRNTPAMHSGTDFRAPMGSDVLAAAGGEVVKAGWNGSYGKMVEIRHANGFTTRYAHMSAVLVTQGQTVSSGDPVGKVGNTGRSTGPHLHYELHRNGSPLNAARFLKAGGTVGKYL